MANYDSPYTGQQVDDSVNFTESFNHTPAEIDSAIDTFETIQSTPANIDEAVNYLQILEGEILPSQIRMTYDYYNDLTVTPSEINDVVTEFNTVNSLPNQIDATVEKIVDNSATLGQVLTANGVGGSSWSDLPARIDSAVDKIDNNSATLGQVLTANGTGGSSWSDLPARPALYHHTATFTRIADRISRWAVEWTDDTSNTSVTASTTLFYLSAFYRNAACPKIISGEFISDEGAQATVNGFYYEAGTNKYVLVSAEQELAEEKFDNFNGWTYSQSTRQIG